MLDFEHEIDGGGGEALCMPAGGSLKPASHETVDQRLHYVKQDGQTVFKFAVRKTEEIARRILERNGLTAADIDLFVSHQANRRIIQSATEKLGVDPSKVIINIERFGNTTAATIPLALDDAIITGRLKKGQLVLLASVGAGFTVGAVSFCPPPTAAGVARSRRCRRTRSSRSRRRSDRRTARRSAICSRSSAACTSGAS
jgi:3-oxoacyl-[acyl-carrier-protein] synthase-3